MALTYLDAKSTIAGWPALEVRRFLRFARFDDWRPGLVSDLFGIPARAARKFVREMERLGLVEAVPNAPTPLTFRRTLAGASLALASAAKPLTRATADRRLAEFLDRVRVVNDSAYYLYLVARVAVFGSYLTDKVRINDVDVAVDLQPKESDPKRRYELELQRRRESGRWFRNISDEVSWPRLEVIQFLKSRSRAIELHTFDDQILDAVPTRLVYPEELSLGHERRSMSSLHRFHPTLRISLLQGQGAMTLEEWEQAAREILVAPAKGIRRILADRRHMGDAYPAWIEEWAMRFIRENAVALGDVQWAVVVDPETSAGKSVATATDLNKGTRVRIQGFGDLTAALRWLLGVYEEEDLVELVDWIEGTEIS